jgi:hypothetical protein
MKLSRFFAAAGLSAAVALVPAVPVAVCQARGDVAAKTIMTVLPKSSEIAPTITPNDVKIKVNGKSVETGGVVALRGDRAGLQLVILIDSGARASLGREMNEIANFVKSLPPTTEVGIAYMMNGRAVFAQPFTNDKSAALRSLHLPGGTVGSSASPYFCISELANHWPSNDTNVRREVVAITDGIDPYEVRFDPDDPYVQTAMRDSIRAGVVVDAIYWHDLGFASRNAYLAGGGQSLLTIVTEKTGGRLYYQGLGNPVSFAPYFRELHTRLENQYELDFMASSGKKPQVQPLKVKLMIPNVKMDSPQMVFVR